MSKQKPDPIETAWYVRLCMPFFFLWALITTAWEMLTGKDDGG